MTDQPTDYTVIAAQRAASSGARLAAAANGCIHYDGMPCRQCGNVMRYTRSSMCVHCTREKQNKARRKWSEMLESSKAPAGS